MTDTTLAIITFVISGLAIIISCWTIYKSRQNMKAIKRIREGRRP